MIESLYKVGEIIFFYFGILTSSSAMANWRQDGWIGLNGPCSCKTGVTITVGFQARILFKWLLELLLAKDLVVRRTLNIMLTSFWMTSNFFVKSSPNILRTSAGETNIWEKTELTGSVSFTTASKLFRS